MNGTAATGIGQPNPDAASLIRRWLDEVWNRGIAETIDELFPEHAVMWGVGRPEESSKGPAEFKLFYEALRSACRENHARSSSAERRHRLCALDRHHDTHRQRTWTASDEPDHEALRNVPLQCEGKIVEGWNVGNHIGLASQLGVLQGQAAEMFR